MRGFYSTAEVLVALVKGMPMSLLSFCRAMPRWQDAMPTTTTKKKTIDFSISTRGRADVSHWSSGLDGLVRSSRRPSRTFSNCFAFFSSSFRRRILSLRLDLTFRRRSAFVKFCPWTLRRHQAISSTWYFVLSRCHCHWRLRYMKRFLY